MPRMGILDQVVVTLGMSPPVKIVAQKEVGIVSLVPRERL